MGTQKERQPTEQIPNGCFQLSTLAWPEYQALVRTNPILVVPVGSIEQHGPHLPLNTDTVIARALAERVASELKGYVAEALPYGMRSDPYSGGGEAYPGTVSLRPETMVSIAFDVLNGFAEDGFRRIFLLNAHYENAPLLREAIRRVTQRHPGVSVLFCNWWDLPPRQQIIALFPHRFPGMDLEHAGLLETSLMLHVAPSLVRNSVPFPSDTVVPSGYEAYPQNSTPEPSSGALASAVGATSEIGERLVELVVNAASLAARKVLGDG